ncbi:MAG: hypothetical protein DI536_09740 [Archangium gephyra]|uniref:Lipoprotein n=1 Tax=Archangium gephyra TaxID=48 RepID=A0A2W5TML0_9BACT|nr:MAG: hypothetical protein DI536_09740 [Archangium gephyra]
MKKLLLMAALAFCACPAPMNTPDGGADAGTGPQDEAEVTRGRLLVADGTAAKLTVIDLDDGSKPGTFTLQGPAAVYSDAEDTLGFGYLVQRANNVTQLVTSGVGFEDHDGHFHIGKQAPTLLSSSIAGATPTHFVLHDGWATIFNDGDGTADFFQTSQLAIGMVAPTRHSTGFAHHGVALVSNGRLLASTPDPVDPAPGASRLPIGVSSRLANDPTMLEGEFNECPRLHGEGSNDTRVAFGCSDGVLVLTWNGSKFESRKIANPAGIPATTRVGTVLGAHDLNVFVGNFGSDALSIIDPAAGTITPVPLPTTYFGFKLFHGEHVIVLTLDGKLHKLDPKTGASQGTPVEVIPAYAMAPTGHDAVRPALALGVDRAYVSDPRSGKVVEVDIEHWEVERTFEVGGAPASMGVVSASPDFGEHHEHEHEEG